MQSLTKQELVDKLKGSGLSVFSLLEYLEIHRSDSVLEEDIRDIAYIRQQGSVFIVNKYTAKPFLNIAFEQNDEVYLNPILKILNIYAYFDYLLYTANENGFSVSSPQLDVTYIKKVKRDESQKKENVLNSNLCLEISISPMMECTLGTKNTAYNAKDLYEKVIYPQFREMLKETIGLEITDISQFDDKAFEILKMAKI